MVQSRVLSASVGFALDSYSFGLSVLALLIAALSCAGGVVDNYTTKC